MDSTTVINENLVPKEKMSFLRTLFSCFRRKIIPTKIQDRGLRSEAEEKVYSWLYTLAQADKDLTFEYVRSTERGLSFKEAERRLNEGGPNIPFDRAYPSWWKLWFNALFQPFNIILLLMGTLSFIEFDVPNGCIMLMLVLISVTLRFHQEYNSSTAAIKLCELLKSPVRVQRCAGRIFQTELVVQIDQKDVVPGDIIIFSPGDIFPGDVRLLTSKDLIISQSSLSGESWVMEKEAEIKEVPGTPLLEMKNICFTGTSVVSGRGTGLVISTGSNTYTSTIFSTVGNENTPDAFEKGVHCIFYALICIMVLVVLIMVILDYYASYNLSESIIFGISAAAALTPQMLPLIVNINLAKGAMAMAGGRCIVKSLSAIQKMGAMDILCIDKTGTLTTDHVIMAHHLDSCGISSQRVLKFAYLNSFFKTEMKGPIDNAIMSHVYTSGFRFESSKWRKIEEIPFDFIRRRMTVIIETYHKGTLEKDCLYSDATRYVITKGALEEVLDISTSTEKNDGCETSVFTSGDRQRILQIGRVLNNDGLRALGVAIKRIETKIGIQTMDTTTTESDMVFLGLLSFYDPPKDSAKKALWGLAEKGVNTKILTGDSLTLAVQICKEVGIGTTHVTTGPHLELLDNDEFHEAVKNVTVFARLTPIQKARVVQSIQREGNHVVGFLGDGINDSPALDVADVGISVDSGASAAKDIADIVLLENDLNVLVSSVELGRLTYGNTAKYIKMSLVANLASVISFLVATIFLQFEPLSPRQILAQNFIYNLGQIAIPWDKMDDGYVDAPRHWSSKELPTFMMWNGPVCSIFDIATFLFIRFYYSIDKLEASAFFHSAWFVEGILMQSLIIHMIRTEKIPFIQNVASGPVIFSTAMVSAVGIMIPFTPIGKTMGLTNLPLSYFGFLVLLFLSYFLFGQVVKRAYIKVYGEWL